MVSFQERSEIVQEAFRRFGGTELTYGQKDCCQYAGWVVEQISGNNYLNEFVYSNEDEAYQIIKKAGGFNALLERVLGAGVKDGFQNGDPVLVELPIVGEALTVWFSGSPCALSGKRFIPVSKDRIIQGWRI